ncbi:hypothetical protein D8674_002929 [Pyrus ussuriensis x Pyrus communis]|uniref:Uncharacterized protein n=1 Tax=Pyrus ussuriensis x Pyrus communis TaxID=2448454 RepID=A0A5N5FUH5_9ROSA|nr:hypothetical protein D8674_002929 [Pyrus ussuriensis x Pyrus communis]
MKKVHVILSISFKYREWCWLLSPLRWEKSRLPPRDEVKRIKVKALACLITVMERAANEGGKKRSSLLAQKMPGEKEEVARSVLATPAVLKATSSITDMIAHHRNSSMPLVLKFVPKHLFGSKSGSPLERFTTMKSDKVPSPAKMTPKPLGYVDYLFGQPSDFGFSSKDFETFFISLKDLLAFTFESSIDEVLGVKRQMMPLLRASRLLKVWRPSSCGLSKLLKNRLLGSL